MAAGRILPRSAWQRRSFAASDCADCIKWPFPLRTAVRRGNRDSRSCVFLLRGSRHAVRRSVSDTNTTATRRRPRGGPRYDVVPTSAPAADQPGTQPQETAPRAQLRHGRRITRRIAQDKETQTGPADSQPCLPQKEKANISLRHRVGPTSRTDVTCP